MKKNIKKYSEKNERECGHCEGTGQVHTYLGYQDSDGVDIMGNIICPYCNGWGYTYEVTHGRFEVRKD